MAWPVTCPAAPVSLGRHQSGFLFICVLRKWLFLLRAIFGCFVFLNTQEQKPIYKTQAPFDRHRERMLWPGLGENQSNLKFPYFKGNKGNSKDI